MPVVNISAYRFAPLEGLKLPNRSLNIGGVAATGPVVSQRLWDPVKSLGDHRHPKPAVVIFDTGQFGVFRLAAGGIEYGPTGNGARQGPVSQRDRRPEAVYKAQVLRGQHA